MSPNNKSRFMPLALAVCLVAGILIGTFYANHFSGNRLNIINNSTNKINDLLRIIDDQYVDTVNMADMVEEVMPLVLSELDPHSAYISAKDVPYLQQCALEQGGLEYAMSKMDELRKKALEIIVPVGDIAVKTALENYISYIVEREK